MTSSPMTATSPRPLAPLLVVTGTGTEIGKTHLTAALAMAWAGLLASEGVPAEVAALKPVETGVRAGAPSDGEILERASTFHVKRFCAPYMLARPVSPHLAAAAEGVTIDLAVIAAHVADVRASASAVIVELPGGLFSPLAPRTTNADLAAALAPDALLLVVPDRLGVLHDVGATTRAAAAQGLAVSGIVVVAPAHADASTGTNAGELGVVTDAPVLAVVPREPVDATARRSELASLLREHLKPKATKPLRL